MANISALIQNKAGRDEARQEERRAERENLSAMRDAALSDVTTTPEKYQRFLTLLGDNIGCSAGNVALAMIQLPNATKTEIYFAKAHDRGRNSDYDRDAYRLDAESVGYMVCRRFGVDCPMPEAENVAQLYDGYEATDRSEALDTLRKTARDMGENIERSIQPRQQERPRRQNAR